MYTYRKKIQFKKKYNFMQKIDLKIRVNLNNFRQ